MKTIEAPLTAILIVFCLGFTLKNYYDDTKLDENKSRTIEVVVPHDGDPETNTVVVTVTSDLKECTDGDKITYLWKQKLGDDVEMTGEETSEMSFEAEAGEYEFTLTVTDPYGASGSENVIVSIGEEPNKAPIPIINYGEEEDEEKEEEVEEEEAPVVEEAPVQEVEEEEAPLVEETSVEEIEE